MSEHVRKVTFNTDYFDKTMFEGRTGKAFHFNSGKLGKFIECEFESPVRISRSRLIRTTDAHCSIKPTFVIQASRNKKIWTTFATVRSMS